MFDKKILIRLFLTIIYFIVIYNVTKNTLNVMANDVEVQEEITVEYHNDPPKSMSNVVEVEVEQYRNLGEFKLTGYCACDYCCGKTDGITATGTVATAGRTIAVDPSIIPYGSIVKINDIEYVAEDCGGAIKDKKVDIFFDSHEEALQWGVKYAEVFIKVGE